MSSTVASRVSAKAAAAVASPGTAWRAACKLAAESQRQTPTHVESSMRPRRASVSPGKAALVGLKTGDGDDRHS